MSFEFVDDLKSEAGGFLEFIERSSQILLRVHDFNLSVR